MYNICVVAKGAEVFRQERFTVPEWIDTTVEEYAAQSLKYLDQSDAEFATGDTRQGAEKLYGAACQIVIAAAKQRGWNYRSHRDNKNNTMRLADEYDDETLLMGFTAAEKFHVHFYHGNLEDYEINVDRPAVRRYVRRMAVLVEEYEANGIG